MPFCISAHRARESVVVAAPVTKADGWASGEDALGVARTGMALLEVRKDGLRLGILVQMRHAHH